jgi:hypothetical protein
LIKSPMEKVDTKSGEYYKIFEMLISGKKREDF